MNQVVKRKFEVFAASRVMIDNEYADCTKVDSSIMDHLFTRWIQSYKYLCGVMLSHMQGVHGRHSQIVKDKGEYFLEMEITNRQAEAVEEIRQYVEENNL